MKHLVKILSLGAAIVASPLAYATTISIGLQPLNSPTVTTVATDMSTPGSAVYAGSFGGFTFNVVTGTGSPIMAPGTLNSTSLQTQATSAGTITVYITEQGLTSPAGLNSFLSAFTANTFGGNATSVLEATLYSSSNALYGGSTLATQTFTGAGTGSYLTPTTLSGLYSITDVYTVTIGAGGGNVNDTVNLSIAATPEPSSLIMLGTGLMSAAGMMVRRRKIS